MRLWDAETGKEIRVFQEPAGVHSVAFSPGGKHVLSASGLTTRLWDVETCQERSIFQWPIGRVTKLAYAPDGSRLAAGGDTGIAKKAIESINSTAKKDEVAAKAEREG